MVLLNLTGVFSNVVYFPKRNEYRQEANLYEAVAGNMDLLILRDILDINMFHVAKLLSLDDFVIKESELKTRVNHLIACVKSMVSLENDIKVLDISIKNFIFEYENTIRESLDKLDCKTFIESILQYGRDPKIKTLPDIGKQLRASYEAENWNKCLGIMIGVNSLCYDTCMYLITNIFNVLYFSFMKYTLPSSNCPAFDVCAFELYKGEVKYIFEKDVIVERILTGAVQKFLTDSARHDIHLRDVILNSPNLGFYAQNHTFGSLQSFIFMHICKFKSVRNVFTLFNIKKIRVNMVCGKYVQKARKFYELWTHSSNEQKLSIYNECNLKEDEEKDIFPFILTLNSPNHERVIEYLRYTINQLLAEKDQCLKNFIRYMFNDFDELFDHCLFPDRETILMLVESDAEEIRNPNEFETGNFSLRHVIEKIMHTDKETLEYVRNKFDTLFNKKSKTTIKYI